MLGSKQIADIVKNGIEKYKAFLKKVDTLYLNADEAEIIMTRIHPTLTSDLKSQGKSRAQIIEAYVKELLNLGIKRVFITDGANPTTAGEKNEHTNEITIKCVPLPEETILNEIQNVVGDTKDTKDTVGCGDAFAATVILLMRMDRIFTLETYIHIAHIVAGMVYRLPKANLEDLPQNTMEKARAFLSAQIHNCDSTLTTPHPSQTIKQETLQAKKQ
jgi:sugar/nucleoside kinase (ribokinase family)